MISSLTELDTLFSAADPVGIAVVNAADEAALASLVPLVEAGTVRPHLIDANEKLDEMARAHFDDGSYEIYASESDADAAAQGVALVRGGVAGALMKGHISSGQFLKAVVDRDRGIRKSNVLSHVAILDSPRFPQLIAVTDGGMVTVPDARQLDAIVDHGVEVMRALGCDTPKVALLSAAETVIPRLPSAEVQKECAAHNTREGVVIEGPLSIDIALVPGIGKEKGYSGQIQGDANIIAVPDIVTGNSLSKSLIYFADTTMAGVVLGAECPIILVSRSATADEKRYSIELAIAMGGNR